MRVMMLPAISLAEDNPYIAMLVGALREQVEVVRFTWRGAVLGSYDVLHVHWPEHLVRADHVLRGWLKLLVLAVVVLRCRLLGVLRVQTVHNLAPHEPGRLSERVGLRLWSRAVDLRILLNDGSTPQGPGRSVTILHGDYQPYLDAIGPVVAPSPPRDVPALLFFGHLRPYKGIERLLHAAADAPDLHLRLRGAAADATYGEGLRRLASDLDHVDLEARRLSDVEVIQEVRAAGAVVLPYVDLYNSGAALLALTIGTPVVLSRSASSEALLREVGPDWVRLLPEDWGGVELRAAGADLLAVRRTGGALGPDRSWDAVARAHLRAYESASRAESRGWRLARTRRSVRDEDDGARTF